MDTFTNIVLLYNINIYIFITRRKCHCSDYKILTIISNTLYVYVVGHISFYYYIYCVTITILIYFIYLIYFKSTTDTFCHFIISMALICKDNILYTNLWYEIITDSNNYKNYSQGYRGVLGYKITEWNIY